MVEKEIGQKSKEMALKGSLEKQTPMRGNFICLKKVPVSWLADEIKKKKSLHHCGSSFLKKA